VNGCFLEGVAGSWGKVAAHGGKYLNKYIDTAGKCGCFVLLNILIWVLGRTMMPRIGVDVGADLRVHPYTIAIKIRHRKICRGTPGKAVFALDPGSRPG
jgi:hypothetical protein